MLANSIVRQPDSPSAENVTKCNTPLPYQIQEFKSSTLIKKFEPDLRVSDSNMAIKNAEDFDLKSKRTKAIILHSDRYFSNRLNNKDNSQKARLEQEEQMLQDARNRIRLRDALSLKGVQHNLHLGGAPIQSNNNNNKLQKNNLSSVRLPPRIPKSESQENVLPQGPISSKILPPTNSFTSFSEWAVLSSMVQADRDSFNREEGTLVPAFGDGCLDKIKMDGSRANFNLRHSLQAELTRLRALVLPEFAKDLYVGRGINLPGNHALNRPRGKLYGNFDNGYKKLPKLVPNETSDKAVVLEESKPKADDTILESLKQNEETPTRTQASSPKSRKSNLLDPFSGIFCESIDNNEITDLKSIAVYWQLPPSAENYLRVLYEQSSLEETRLNICYALAKQIATLGGTIREAFAHESPEGVVVNYCLELFHEVDREDKGSISLSSLISVAGSVKKSPLDAKEEDVLKSQFSEFDNVDKLSFLVLIPYIVHLSSISS